MANKYQLAVPGACGVHRVTLENLLWAAGLTGNVDTEQQGQNTSLTFDCREDYVYVARLLLLNDRQVYTVNPCVLRIGDF